MIAEAPTTDARPARARPLVRAGALVAYAAVVAYVVHRVHGIPASREVLVPLILGGFLALSLTSVQRLRRFAIGLAVDWLPFVLALWLYDLVRGWADDGLMPVHVLPQIDADRVAGLGSVPTVWLQQHLWHGDAHIAWYDFVAWATYMSFFFAPTVLLAVLWWRRPELFRRFAAMVVGLAFVGCVGFLLFPAAPPWLAAQDHVIPHVSRLIGDVNLRTSALQFPSLWETGTRYDNAVAAIPSLHAGYTLLLTIFLVRRWGSRLRHLLWLYPLLMAFALVYSGEHYLADVVLGWVCAVGVYAAVEWIATRSRGSASRAG